MGIQTIATAGLGGLLAGIYFFGGLWWTVRKGLFGRHPLATFLGSFILRYGVVLLVFYAIFSSGTWLNHIVPCLLGFIISRAIVKQVTRKMSISSSSREGGQTCI